jgi:hypothetical protein
VGTKMDALITFQSLMCSLTANLLLWSRSSECGYQDGCIDEFSKAPPPFGSFYGWTSNAIICLLVDVQVCLLNLFKKAFLLLHYSNITASLSSLLSTAVGLTEPGNGDINYFNIFTLTQTLELESSFWRFKYLSDFLWVGRWFFQGKGYTCAFIMPGCTYDWLRWIIQQFDWFPRKMYLGSFICMLGGTGRLTILWPFTYRNIGALLRGFDK